MIVYLIENLINHKIYIGQTKVTIADRFNGHKKDSKRTKRAFSYLHNAMAKYGIENFEISKISEASSKEELDKLETWFIKFFESTNREIGYNIEHGGNGPNKVSEETRKKLSIASSGKNNHSYGKPAWNRGIPLSDNQKKKLSKIFKGKKFSEETKRKIAESRTKKPCSFLGKKHSKESLEKMAKAAMNRKHSEETKQKISKATKGRKLSEETKKKLSESKKGNKNPSYGKVPHNKGVPLSLEQKEKMSKALTGKKHSDEAKKKMSESGKKAWIKRKLKKE